MVIRRSVPRKPVILGLRGKFRIKIGMNVKCFFLHYPDRLLFSSIRHVLVILSRRIYDVILYTHTHTHNSCPTHNGPCSTVGSETHRIQNWSVARGDHHLSWHCRDDYLDVHESICRAPEKLLLCPLSSVPT